MRKYLLSSLLLALPLLGWAQDLRSGPYELPTRTPM
jgi:hypothetical protein